MRSNRPRRPPVRVDTPNYNVSSSRIFEILKDSEFPYPLFVFNQRICRLVGGGRLEVMDADTLAHEIRLRMILQRRRKGALTEVHSPPGQLVRHMIKAVDPPLKEVRSICYSPMYSAGGRLMHEKGYYADDKTYMAETTPIHMPNRLSEARATIDMAYHDFPFEHESDYSNSVGLLILTLVRSMVDGPVPFHLVSASTPGTGKTLLIDTILEIGTGGNYAKQMETTNPEELRKRLSSTLRAGRQAIFLDNLNGRIDSGAFAALLTSREISDRELGRSNLMVLNNDIIWVGSANHPSMTREMARRTVWMRLMSLVADPTKRSGFLIPDLYKWARSNRGKVLGAVCFMVDEWLSAGQPPFSGKPLASFVEFSNVVGGILEFAGYRDFLKNTDDWVDIDIDPLSEAWNDFVSAWASEIGNTPVRAQSLVAIAMRELGPPRTGETERGHVTRLGKEISRRVGDVIGEWRIAVTRIEDRTHYYLSGL